MSNQINNSTKNKKNSYITRNKIASLTNTTVQALRYYEKKNLMSPEYIADNGYHYYSEEILSKVNLIVRLKSLGLDIEKIKCFFSLGSTESSYSLLVKCREDKERELLKIQKQLKKINRFLKNID
ncbi:hypothetical protein PM10SUCC1_29100 [Propionigenium maris DSM 9537]|uniref:HTH merR-type domain-containing protein n=1 Tax=Propionigenium maris DSM 9537 TaxID=1123000 RepID=A0A9W6GPA6_9FUSO|nr:MerR family transcriptional regulator [Propionigenium maris]GLI57396.1 hypothetical protein PM10SUCC1_29100 [Propionigenium maris DSM 9537]